MIVLDASVVVELLFGTPLGKEVRERISDDWLTLHVPAVLDLEVAQVVRRYTALGQIEPDRGRQALEYLVGLNAERYVHGPFLQRIWQLRHNLTAYDAAYVALAEALGATLLTADRGMASAAARWVKVESLSS